MTTVFQRISIGALNNDARQMFDHIDAIYAFRLPLKRRFRRITQREGVLIHGPGGWAEISPFWDYGPAESFSWVFAGLEAATIPFDSTPMPAGYQSAARYIPVNVTIPVTDPKTAYQLVKDSGGCHCAKIKVADPGTTLDDDIARVEAVRAAFDDLGVHDAQIRLDVNAAWQVDQAAKALTHLERAARDIAYVEQPCAHIDQLVELRQRIHIPVAADESVRRAADPLEVVRRGGADVLIVKNQPLGGISRVLHLAEQAQLPVVVSSALDSSVGLARSAQLASALPQPSLPCGLATAQMLSSDVTATPLLPRNGFIKVGTIVPDIHDSLGNPGTLDRADVLDCTANTELSLRWIHRLNTIAHYAAATHTNTTLRIINSFSHMGDAPPAHKALSVKAVPPSSKKQTPHQETLSKQMSCVEAPHKAGVHKEAIHEPEAHHQIYRRYDASRFRVAIAHPHIPQAPHTKDIVSEEANSSDTTTQSQATYAARALVTALIASGVRDIVVCPGSRNAPLTYALKHASDAGLVRTHVRIDERSAAYFALGLAKAGRAAPLPESDHYKADIYNSHAPSDPPSTSQPSHNNTFTNKASSTDTANGRALSGCVPVALMMTSGTAVMNAHPAISEACHSWTPLIVVSADRPAYLQGKAANQTTRQWDAFGSAVRWRADVGTVLDHEHVFSTSHPACDDILAIWGNSTAKAWMTYMSYLVDEGLTYAYGHIDKDPGPIHINMQFDDPLVENSPWKPTSTTIATAQLPPENRLAANRAPDNPRFGYAINRDGLSRQWGLELIGKNKIVASLREAINPALTTVIVACDPGAPNRMAAQTIIELSERTHWPILAEPSSFARAGKYTPCDYQHGLTYLHDNAVQLGLTSIVRRGNAPLKRGVYGQHLWSNEDMTSHDGIEQVIVLGHPTLSRPITRLVESPYVRQIRVSPWGTVFDTGGVVDAVVTHLPHSDDVDAIAAEVATMTSQCVSLRTRQETVTRTLMEHSQATQHFGFFGQVVQRIWEDETSQAGSKRYPLMLGSSNTIRLFDRCATPTPTVDTLPYIFTNRGLAGIDGTIAAARGLASGLGIAVRAIMGDLTFLHDASSLLNGKFESTSRIQICVLNDNGGSIFHDLEHGQPQHRDVFNRYFLTPQQATIQQIARGFHAHYCKVETLQDLDEVLHRDIRPGCEVIEVCLPEISQ
ncbi:MAG: o-succinylbenzoate synthase [Actinomycetaceae bacterium]|nr:o-succinylbenzoate synthase [Actinomycetaceae bacterium]